MATPAQLMEIVSTVTGLPLPTVVDIDRRLVAGGLRTKGGRGLNVARMTPLDAARLLAAILGSPLANASVDAVQRYAQTHVDKRRSGPALYAETGIDELTDLPARHSFVDALSALLTSLSMGSLIKVIAAASRAWRPHIEIFAFTRVTYGRIRLGDLPNGASVSVEYVAASSGAAQRRGDAIVPRSVGDLEQSRRITDRTLLAVAKVLGEDKGHERG